MKIVSAPARDISASNSELLPALLWKNQVRIVLTVDTPGRSVQYILAVDPLRKVKRLPPGGRIICPNYKTMFRILKLTNKNLLKGA